MKWIKIDLYNLPKGKVLAINIADNVMVYGEIVLETHYKTKEKIAFCENGDYDRDDHACGSVVTHYVDPDELLKIVIFDNE